MAAAAAARGHVLLPEHLMLTVHSDEATQAWHWPLDQGLAVNLQDAGGTQWCELEPLERGVRDLRRLDAYARACARMRMPMLWTPRGVPVWCRTSERPDGYNLEGGSSMPTDEGLAGLRDTVAEVVWRCNRPSPVNPFGQRLMPVVKPLNEPRWDFEPTLETNDTPPDWSAAVRWVAAVWEGAKVADPGVVVTTPAFPGGHVELLKDYLLAEWNGRKGLYYAGGVALNLYGMDTVKLRAVLLRVRAIMGEVGMPRSARIYITEAGYQDRWKPAFMALPAQRQGPELANCILLAAAMGVAMYSRYSWNPNPRAVALGEVMPVQGTPLAEACGLLRPFVGHQVQELGSLDGEVPGARRRWKLGARKVVV